jgi:hypothetical protein
MRAALQESEHAAWHMTAADKETRLDTLVTPDEHRNRNAGWAGGGGQKTRISDQQLNKQPIGRQNGDGMIGCRISTQLLLTVPAFAACVVTDSHCGG